MGSDVLHSLTQVKDEFSSFVRQAEAGATIRIAVNGRPAARLVADRHSPSHDGGWTLASTGVSRYLPYPFMPADVEEARSGRGNPDEHMREYLESNDGAQRRPGVARLLQTWAIVEGRGREHAVVWRHLLTGAAVIAVPTGGWREGGSYRFFHTLSVTHPIVELQSWSDEAMYWHSDNAGEFSDARQQVRTLGSSRLGL